MADFVLDTVNRVTPLNRGGPFVGVAGAAKVKRVSTGAITIALYRGDGALDEDFTLVDARTFAGPAGELVDVYLGATDLPAFQVDFTARSYRMVISTPDDDDITVVREIIATEPYKGTEDE